MELNDVRAIQNLGAEHIRRLIDVHRTCEDDVRWNLQRLRYLHVLAANLRQDPIARAVQQHIRPALHGRQEVGEVVLDLREVHLIEYREVSLVRMCGRMEQELEKRRGHIPLCEGVVVPEHRAIVRPVCPD